MSIQINSSNEVGLKSEKVSYVGQGISGYTKYSYTDRPDATALENMSVSIQFNHSITFLLICVSSSTGSTTEYLKPRYILNQRYPLLSTSWPTSWNNGFELAIDSNCYETGFGWIFTAKTNATKTKFSFAAFNYLDSSSTDLSIKNNYAAYLMLLSPYNIYHFFGFY